MCLGRLYLTSKGDYLHALIGVNPVGLGSFAITSMDKDDRIRACYLHACLKYVERDFMTNTTLRERFGIEGKNSATASRIIRETVEAGAIHPYDETAGRKFMKYVPCWA